MEEGNQRAPKSRALTMFKTNREVIVLQSLYTRCKTDVSPDVFALCLRNNVKEHSHFLLANALI